MYNELTCPNIEAESTDVSIVNHPVPTSQAVTHVVDPTDIDENRLETTDTNVVAKGTLLSKEEVVAGTAKRKRYTTQEKFEITKLIKNELINGKPLQAIGLNHNLTLDFLRKIFAKLMMTDFRNKIQDPTYEVELAGIQVNKLHGLELNGAKFVRIERHEKGVYIRPFHTTDYNA